MSDQPLPSHPRRRWVLLAYWAVIFLLTHRPEISRLQRTVDSYRGNPVALLAERRLIERPERLLDQ